MHIHIHNIYNYIIIIIVRHLITHTSTHTHIALHGAYDRNQGYAHMHHMHDLHVSEEVSMTFAKATACMCTACMYMCIYTSLKFSINYLISENW